MASCDDDNFTCGDGEIVIHSRQAKGCHEGQGDMKAEIEDEFEIEVKIENEIGTERSRQRPSPLSRS